MIVSPTVGPSLAVLITYHNEKELLTECLRSLVASAQPPEEILIYDDASEAPAKDYIPDGIHPVLVRGIRNRGPAHGRNVLMSSCRSEYLHFHDCDDLFAPSWHESIRGALKRGADVVFTEISSFASDGSIRHRILGLEELHKGGDLVSFCLKNIILTCAGTYRTQVVREMGGFREQMWHGEDFDFHVRLAAQSLQVEVIREALIHRRIRPDSLGSDPVRSSDGLVESIKWLSQELPVAYHRELADLSAQVSSFLFRRGAWLRARRGFGLAHLLIESPKFSEFPKLYRNVARRFGQQTAEWASLLYRLCLPLWLRRRLRQEAGA